MVILDGFCGWGQNAIQLALSNGCKKVVAVDSNEDAIKCARHNAELYEIADKIEFVCEDIFAYIERTSNASEGTKFDAVFMSPPWGGPNYNQQEKYDLDNLDPKPW
jgi:trimethylguanosine synthase